MRYPIDILLGCLMVVLCSVSRCYAQPATEQDVLYQVLSKQNNQQFLHYAQQSIPCLALIYKIDEHQEDILSYNFGACYQDLSTFPERTLTVSMIVGYPDFHCAPDEKWPTSTLRLPYTSDTILLNHLIDRTTRQAYNEAVNQYQKQVIDTILNEKKEHLYPSFPSDTFYYEAIPTDRTFSRTEVKQRLSECTQAMGAVKDLSQYIGKVNYVTERHYYISSSGASLAYNTTSAILTLSMGDHTGKTVTSTDEIHHPDNMPPSEQLMQKSEELYQQLMLLPSQGNSSDRRLMRMRDYDENVIETDYFPDIIFKAMQDEAEANFSELQLPDGSFPPYRIGYLVSDLHQYHVVSSLGYPVDTQDQDHRFVVPEVKIGSDLLNNTPMNNVSATLSHRMSISNNYNAIREDLRIATEKAYRQAIREYVDKQQTISHLKADISKFLPERTESNLKTDIQYQQHSHIDIGDFQSITDELSGLFLTDSLMHLITESSVTINGVQGNVYYYATDQLQYAKPITLFQIRIDICTAQGDSLSTTINFNNNKVFRNHDTLITWATDFIQTILKASQAQAIKEAYYGPVLLTGAAVGQWLAKASQRLIVSDISENLTADIFAQNIDHRILSSILDIQVVTPSKKYNTEDLWGGYLFDAEGVVPENGLEIVRRGELITLCNDRRPTKHIQHSNGHSRLAIADGPHIEKAVGPGILEYKTHNKQSINNLIKLLCKQAQGLGYRYAYIITDLTHLSTSHSHFPIIYRINVHSKRTSIVKQAKIEEDAFWSLQKLAASGEQSVSFNELIHASNGGSLIPISILAPNALLFEKMAILPTSQ